MSGHRFTMRNRKLAIPIWAYIALPQPTTQVGLPYPSPKPYTRVNGRITPWQHYVRGAVFSMALIMSLAIALSTILSRTIVHFAGFHSLMVTQRASLVNY